VSAGLALFGETVGEEHLHCRCDRAHEVTCVPGASRRSAANASSSGAADRYQ
jgi:hypothetical protein